MELDELDLNLPFRKWNSTPGMKNGLMSASLTWRKERANGKCHNRYQNLVQYCIIVLHGIFSSILFIIFIRRIYRYD